jgi:uncharacterized protein (DUF1800 family)
MEATRRQVIQWGGAAAAAAALPAGLAMARDRPPLAWTAHGAADMPAPDLAALLLSRAAFGARPGEVERARDMGPDAWIEEQLAYESIDVAAMEGALVEVLPTLSWSAKDIITYGRQPNQQDSAMIQLRVATVYRQAFSPRQLYEVMVDFWSDHFSVDHRTDYVRYFKTVDDRDCIRQHALGKFKELLLANAMSPCMLNFLNNDVSTYQRPNENYAREVMELHTLGVAVNGVPYTEQDVKEVAKCLTGWSWDTNRNSQKLGDFEFRAKDHDDAAKTVLGQIIPARGGQNDGRLVVDILCASDYTARFLARKLVRRFVTDDPPGQCPELVQRVADAFKRTDGDIKEMVSTILRSREFAASFGQYGGRLSRPLDLVARSLRAVSYDPGAGRDGVQAFKDAFPRVNAYLTAMGQVPFYWATPDGYPDVKEAWAASSVMLTRWNMGLALCGVGEGGALFPGFAPTTPDTVTTAGAAVDYWVDRLLHRPVTAEDRTTLVQYLTNGGGDTTPIAAVRTRLPFLVAVILDSPYFQWR